MSACGCLRGVMGNLLGGGETRDNRGKYAAEEDVCVQFKELTPVHTDAVTSVASIQNGLTLSGSKDKSMVLFDMNAGQVKARFTGHEKEITKVAYGESIQSYLSASRDKTVCMWQDGEETPTLTFTGHELVVTGLALNQDNNLLVTGSRDNSLRLWDTTTGACITQNQISRNLVTDVCWAKGSDLLAQTGEDKDVRLWDPNSLQVIHTFPRKQYIQTSCDISEDGNLCVSASNGFGGRGCEISIWDLRNRSLMYELEGHTETVQACRFLPQAITAGRKLIATSSSDTTVKIWDYESREMLDSVNLPGSGPLTSIAAHLDGSLYVASFNTGVQVLQLRHSNEGYFTLTRTGQY